jgi:hypothetical protein
VWVATRYLSGSVSSETPYETVYGLNLALREWCPNHPRELVITTSLTSERMYHFQGISPQFYQVVKHYLGVDFQFDLVRIALPRLYKHQPLFNAALYHELGHFVDENFRISRTAMLSPQGRVFAIAILQNGADPESHFAEYFADVFAASYVGEAMIHVLERLFPGDNSLTHPGTSVRTALIRNFLAGGQPAPLLAAFQNGLSALGLSALSRRFSVPDIGRAFRNIRPHNLGADSELHGIFESAYALLAEAEGRTVAPWDLLEEQEAVRIVNDLVEKSIRNRMILQKWASRETP